MDYVMHAPRVDIISANKEGLISLTGRLPLRFHRDESRSQLLQDIFRSISSDSPRARFYCHLLLASLESCNTNCKITKITPQW
jgi:hypothetical protein